MFFGIEGELESPKHRQGFFVVCLWLALNGQFPIHNEQFPRFEHLYWFVGTTVISFDLKI
ncbi:MAG: hypothetical protein DRR19_13595 [Candidatus Parabeggiatoa sp. nov. 1]|nr:MAG: hypothetical protein DRR19_13595 [Gammaproteobacteria bacterium]